MQQLIQEKGFHYRAFTLREDDVLVHLRDFENEREFSVDYIDLGLQIYRKTEHHSRALRWLSGGVAAIMLIALISSILGFELIAPAWAFALGILAALACSWTFLQQKPGMIYLIGGENKLGFLQDRPNSEQVEAFISATIDKIRESYHQQYLHNSNDNTDEDRRSRIQWLHEMKAITRSEKDVLLAELGPVRQQPIGFQRTA
ncbi:MAG: hypothetical protein ACRBG0_09145 [Lewinella sp.]|uniref:hypothetical protein n=1 Tax=Lewinella sp. TaxID=2004506 RepID=UPI003D6A1C8D